MAALPWHMQTDDAASERPPYNSDLLPFPELLGSHELREQEWREKGRE